MKKEDIEIFIDGIENPAEPNQALKDAAERLKGKELFKESNDRAKKILSEIKSLPIQERPEKYSERFDNKDNEIVDGIFNPDTWGKRMVEEPNYNMKQEIIAEMEKQETLEDKLKLLVEEWRKRQIHYEEVAEDNITSEHNNRKFTYKAMATRDCWKELLKLIEDEK